MGFRIGVDGGATKTECIVVDASGAVLRRHVAPGSNPNVSGEARVRSVIEDALAEISRDLPGPIEMTLLCMAGSRPFWDAFAAALTGYGRTAASDDSLPVLELATDGLPGLVLHAGTGSFVVARAPDGTRHYAGGLGWRFGDEGSGYDIGRRAIARALQEIQGFARPSAVGALIRDPSAESQTAPLFARYYTGAAPNADIASWAPKILELADKGDGAALAVVGESVGDLADLAARVAATLFPGVGRGALRAGLSGPILTHPVSTRILAAHRTLAFTAVEGTPAEGLRRLLARGSLT